MRTQQNLSVQSDGFNPVAALAHLVRNLLSPQDLLTVRLVFEQGGMHCTQLDRFFGHTYSTTRRVVQRLERLDLLRTAPCTWRTSEWVVATRRGAYALNPEFGTRDYSERLPLAKVRSHYSLLTAARLFWEQVNPRVSWTSERMLYFEGYLADHRPDALATVAGVTHAIEMELTPKTDAEAARNIKSLLAVYDAVHYYGTPLVVRQMHRLQDQHQFQSLYIHDLTDLSAFRP